MNISEIILTEVSLNFRMTFMQLAPTGILIAGHNNLSEVDDYTCASEKYVTLRAVTHDPSLSVDAGRQCRSSFW